MVIALVSDKGLARSVSAHNYVLYDNVRIGDTHLLLPVAAKYDGPSPSAHCFMLLRVVSQLNSVLGQFGVLKLVVSEKPYPNRMGHAVNLRGAQEGAPIDDRVDERTGQPGRRRRRGLDDDANTSAATAMAMAAIDKIQTIDSCHISTIQCESFLLYMLASAPER